ncbi:MAG: dephospho-CoA kinase [Pseudomonadota bacterium]
MHNIITNRNNNGKLVGITGSVASGKSSVLSYLKELGYEVFSADEVVKEMYKSEAVQQKVLEILPEIEAFSKARIASVIYSDQAKRIKLENFIHPIIRQRLKVFRGGLGGNLGFAEIPLLFEKALEKEFDYVIVISCSGLIRKKRAIERGMLPDVFDMICKIQMPDEEKQKRADFVIKTDVDLISWKKNLGEIIKNLEQA